MGITRVGILLLLLSLVCAGLLSGCGYDLPDNFEEEAVTERSHQVIDLLNAGDYATVSRMFRADVQESMPAEKLEESLSPIFEKLGEFQSFQASATAGTKDKDTKAEYAVIVVACVYEKGKAQFTMYFDTEMALVGLYIK